MGSESFRRLMPAGIAALALLVATGCGSGLVGDERAAPSATVQPVVLPDLTRMAGPVQAQIRSRHAAVQARMADAGATPAARAEAQGELGKILLAAEQYSVATVSFQNAETLAPEDRRWPYYLGHTLLRLQDASAAAEAFERARALAPGDVPTLLALGDAYLASGRPEAAEPPLLSAQELQPRSAAVVAALGRVALALREFERAVSLLESALAREQRAMSLHYPLAMAYRGAGNEPLADAHLRRRGEGQPSRADPLMEEIGQLLDSVSAYEVQGVDALGRGDWAGAIEAFRRGMALSPEDPSMRHRLATALALSGDTQGAIAQFREVVRRSPGYARSRLSLGVLLESVGERREAVMHLSAAATLDPQFAEAHLRLAEVLHQSGRLRDARVRYERALEVDPYATDARLGLTAVLMAQGMEREAHDVLERGVRAQPDDPRLAHALARGLAASNDAGVRNGRRALAIGDSLSGDGLAAIDRAETRAMALAELGRFDEAQVEQRFALAAAQRAGLAIIAERLDRNLKSYEANRPMRAPWSSIDAFRLATD